MGERGALGRGASARRRAAGALAALAGTDDSPLQPMQWTGARWATGPAGGTAGRLLGVVVDGQSHETRERGCAASAGRTQKKAAAAKTVTRHSPSRPAPPPARTTRAARRGRSGRVGLCMCGVDGNCVRERARARTQAGPPAQPTDRCERAASTAAAGRRGRAAACSGRRAHLHPALRPANWMQSVTPTTGSGQARPGPPCALPPAQNDAPRSDCCGRAERGRQAHGRRHRVFFCSRWGTRALTRRR